MRYILDKSEIKGDVKGYVFNSKHNVCDTCYNCYGIFPSFRPQPYNPNHQNTITTHITQGHFRVSLFLLRYYFISLKLRLGLKSRFNFQEVVAKCEYKKCSGMLINCSSINSLRAERRCSYSKQSNDRDSYQLCNECIRQGDSQAHLLTRQEHDNSQLTGQHLWHSRDR